MRDLKELVYNLGKIEKDIDGAIIKAQRETAESICQDARMMAPWKTRQYERSIHVTDTQVIDKKISTSIVTDATVTAKSNGNEYNLGKLLEEGTKPHEIRPVQAEALQFQVGGEDGEWVITKLVHHPGFEPYPHFGPALWLNENLFQQKISRLLDKEFK